MNPEVEQRRAIERTLARFDGLIAVTARQIIQGGVELELEDVTQLLRVKVWRTIERYDSSRPSQLPLQRFVFGCLYNLRKDIEKRPRRYNCSIEEQRHAGTLTTSDGVNETGNRADWFDGRYLSVDAEQVYAQVEDEEVALPSTLTPIERRVIALRLEGKLLLEIDREAGLSRAQRERVMRSIREKLADWAPNAAPQRSAPTPPLPGVVPRSTLARAALAA